MITLTFPWWAGVLVLSLWAMADDLGERTGKWLSNRIRRGPVPYPEAVIPPEDPACPLCDGTGLVEDPSACGDPEHCAGWIPCPNGCPDPEFREQSAAFMDRNDELLRRLADG